MIWGFSKRGLWLLKYVSFPIAKTKVLGLSLTGLMWVVNLFLEPFTLQKEYVRKTAIYSFSNVTFGLKTHKYVKHRYDCSVTVLPI
jgi:hypothetical protein